MIPEQQQPIDNLGSPVTIGNWLTEAESVAALDEILSVHSDLFIVKREVWGRLIQPAYGQDDKAVRIDRIVIPNKALLAQGWKHGAFGIECKKSGEKIGQPIAQSTDYSRSIWTLPDSGLRIYLDMVFLWPMAPQHGPLASVMYQQRVGSAFSSHWYKLVLKLGEVNALRLANDGTLVIGPAPEVRRVGSR